MTETTSAIPEQPAPPPASPADATASTPAKKEESLLGFLFFLLKGLGWLLVGFLAWKGLS